MPYCGKLGLYQVDEYADAENELTKVYVITRNEWQMLTGNNSK